MKKLLMVLMASLALTACKLPWDSSTPSPSPSPTPSPTPGPGPSPAPTPAPNPEPASHKQPVAIDASGRKLGTCVKMGSDVQTWVHQGTAFSPAPSQACTGNEVVGQPCNSGGCVQASGGYMICQTVAAAFDCYAWVYEQDSIPGGVTYKPLAGSQAYVVDFPYDMNPQSSQSVSDQWGYVEVTGSEFNQFNFYAPAGYWMGQCSFGKPWLQEGAFSQGVNGQAFQGAPTFQPLVGTPCATTAAQAQKLKVDAKAAPMNVLLKK